MLGRRLSWLLLPFVLPNRATVDCPLLAGCTNSAKSFQNRRRYAGRNDEWQFSEMRLSRTAGHKSPRWPLVFA